MPETSSAAILVSNLESTAYAFKTATNSTLDKSSQSLPLLLTKDLPCCG